jgi:IS5 family transposase
LEPGGSRHAQRAGQKGGFLTGPNPTDRGKPGSKQHVAVERHGIPLAVTLTAANEHDSIQFEGLIAALPRTKQRYGYRRERPNKVHADKGYDFPRCRQFLSRRGIRVRIARRKVDSSERLGRHRWVVERSLAWLARYRKLTIRYERKPEIHIAFLTLACALVCLGRLVG